LRYAQTAERHDSEFGSRGAKLRWTREQYSCQNCRTAFANDAGHEQMQLGAELSTKLADIKVAAENYPELKADKQFLRLEESIEDMEYQLQAARRTFNAAAVDFNNYVQMFPSNIIAGMKNYALYDLITIPESEKANVDVKALFKN
jgi:LemA protein